MNPFLGTSGRCSHPRPGYSGQPYRCPMLSSTFLAPLFCGTLAAGHIRDTVQPAVCPSRHGNCWQGQRRRVRVFGPVLKCSDPLCTIDPDRILSLSRLTQLPHAICLHLQLASREERRSKARISNWVRWVGGRKLNGRVHINHVTPLSSHFGTILQLNQRGNIHYTHYSQRSEFATSRLREVAYTFGKPGEDKSPPPPQYPCSSWMRRR